MAERGERGDACRNAACPPFSLTALSPAYSSTILMIHSASTQRFRLASLLFAALLPAAARADVSVLQTKGPWTGSIGSLPAALEPASGNALTLISAKVKIRIARGTGEELLALCSAKFVIHDERAANAGEQDCQMAFPVTGLNAKIVTTDDFSVHYDNDQNKPSPISRHPIVIWVRPGRKPLTFDPTGQMEGAIFPEAPTPFIRLPPASIVYRDAYLWHMKSSPGSTNILDVTYTAHLRPQSLQYSKAYAHRVDTEVIPFDFNPASQWDKRYYFFDYILVSGSTWNGPIGHETVEITVDPDLSTILGQIESNLRPEFRNWRELHDRGYYELAPGTNSFRWEIKGKPTSDLIFGLPIK